MKRTITTLVTLSIATMALYSCRKTSDAVAPGTSQTTVENLHGMGLNPMQPSEWANVPAFSPNLLKGKLAPDGLTYNGTAYNSYLLVTPQIRDQGQTGACTGFCGAETDEILYYYKNNSVAPIDNFATANGIPLATQNQIPNTSDAPAYGGASNATAAFSPLFLYFVERVVIEKYAIGADPGANMVNIGQALQGLSNNSGTGSALTYSTYTFAGIPNEAKYPYPWVAGSGGYNVSTSSDSPYQVYPYNYYNYNSTTIPVAPNKYNIGAQSGSTNSGGTTTTAGYYVITSTGTSLVNDVKTALLNNKPVMMGFNVYDNTRTYQYFENLNTTKYTYNPLNSSGGLAQGVRLLGGHAVPIVGYINDNTLPGGGVFIVQNSWGTPWGNHGYFYLPYSVIQSTRVVPSGSLYVAVL